MRKGFFVKSFELLEIFLIKKKKIINNNTLLHIHAATTSLFGFPKYKRFAILCMYIHEIILFYLQRRLAA